MKDFCFELSPREMGVIVEALIEDARKRRSTKAEDWTLINNLRLCNGWPGAHVTLSGVFQVPMAAPVEEK